jgi:anti-anti-sigma factor
VRTSVEADRVVVALAGECDLASRAALTEALLAAVERAPVVIVDLGALRFLDSSGLHGLVTAYRAAQERGGRLHAVNAGGTVATVLAVTGLDGLLQPPAGGNG